MKQIAKENIFVLDFKFIAITYEGIRVYTNR